MNDNSMHETGDRVMSTYYKAVRRNGTDFYTGMVQWAPPDDHEGEWIVRCRRGLES